ncbi:MAG: hypothetical protein H0T73_17280 [Ardenticatenales bacterium]|nr:hypothetical protein [Ardenticatenales bacterium]
MESTLSDQSGGGAGAAVLMDRDEPPGWQVWLLPGLLLLFVLAPLLRAGLPATQVGALPLLGVGAMGYKAMMALAVVTMTGLVGLFAGKVWGMRLAWWALSLWLLLPLTISFIYQHGSLSALWQWRPALEPYQLFWSPWPTATNPREWVQGISYQLGLVPVALALLAAVTAWPRRGETEARKILFFTTIAGVGIALTLLGGPVLLWLRLATLALLLAAAGLPVLDPRYASFPVLLALLTLAGLNSYPALQPAWLVGLPAQPNGGQHFGEQQFLLLDLQSQRTGEETTIEVLWQVLGPPGRDYTAFVHLLDGAGNVVAQADTLLVDTENVTSARWPVGYVVRHHYLAASSTPPTHLRLGLYDRETLQRLPLPEGGDSVTIPLQ